MQKTDKMILIDLINSSGIFVEQLRKQSLSFIIQCFDFTKLLVILAIFLNKCCVGKPLNNPYWPLNDFFSFSHDRPIIQHNPIYPMIFYIILNYFIKSMFRNLCNLI